MAETESLARHVTTDVLSSTAVSPHPGVRTLPQYFEQTCDRRPDDIALVCGSSRLSYAELDRRANQLANMLLERGATAGRPLGILLERSLDTYIALLGVLKAGAAYVPLDPSFPADRLAFIAQDAGLCDLVTTSASRERTQGLTCPVLELDEADAKLAVQPDSRPCLDIAPSSPCYVIYTSGSTGKPKGVAISHASIVNFLRVATPVYGVTSEDRVYQGMSISFDFHLEEMWPAWVAGATLIAGPTDARRFGQGLSDFLAEHEVTVFCSVPTLLTTIEVDPPSVRCLLVSGEPMPADLVCRWSRPGRRILNCYGPTETTVSASCCELRADRPVTLGVPFATYSFYVLDEELREVAEGETGEICIGGPGVAIGYLNRCELTAERFVPNPVERDRAEVPRIYRTGDLGRRISTGEFEYLGRMDTQVKIRGYRIELGEIEQAIREDHAVANAVVTAVDRDGAGQDLVGYVTLHANAAQNGTGDLRTRLHASLRRRLAPYMVPSFIEVLDSFPLLAADKVNRAALPRPVSPPLAARSGPHVPAETPLEGELAEVWGQILNITEVSVEDDFFCDLGGHSMVAARVISRLRERPAMRGLAMGDLYAHPTIRGLARFIADGLATLTGEESVAPERPKPRRHSTLQVLGCGLAQLVLLYAWMLLLAVPALALVYAALLRIGRPVRALPISDVLTRLSNLEMVPLALLWFAWFLVTIFLLPVAGSRLMMRGVRPGRYPLWGFTYLRFWCYGKIVALAPLALLTGTPMLPLYLRLLGAKVGRRCQLSSAAIGLAKFIEIGDGASIGYGVRVQSYVVADGWLRLAPIRIGTGSFVGTNSGVLAGAEIGDHASVGEQSLVHSDHRVPAGEHWAGSPVTRRKTAPALLETMAEHRDDRRWPLSVLMGYVGGLVLLVLVPVLAATPSAVLVIYVVAHAGLAWGIASVSLAGPLFVLVTCLVLILAKRAVLSTVRPGIYPERRGLGVRLWLSNHLADMSVTMIRTIYCTLYVVPFLRGLGLRMGRWCEVAIPTHINPDMTHLGDQCFLAAGIVMAPPVYHHGHIALAPAELGRRGFVGNIALVPGGCRMGDNSLLGVLSVPPARPIDPETTWLGSPAIFLPRREASANFPEKLTYSPSAGLVTGRLAIELFRVTLPAIILLTGGLLGASATVELAALLPPLVVLALLPALGLGLGLASTLLVVLLKWLIIGRYRPRTEPYWGIWVRRTELITGLYEAVAVPVLVNSLTGTPWIALVLRLFGARVGRRAWIATTNFTEFDLVEIGDDAAVGEDTCAQTHLFEDRVMKMSFSKVGTAASVGTHSVVLYDAEAAAGSCLDALSLVMKGEILPAESRWRGIPARPL
jgi:non-ribosomal peptide synthetase-like protein